MRDIPLHVVFFKTLPEIAMRIRNCSVVSPVVCLHSKGKKLKVKVFILNSERL